MATIPYNVVIKNASGNSYQTERFSDLSWERYENEVGRCKFSVPYSDTKLLSALETDNQFFEILIYRDGSLVWQGFIAFLLDELNQTTIFGLDYKECLKWYLCQYNVEYTSKKIGTEILSPEWDNIDARTGAILGDKIVKGTFQDPYTTGSSSTFKTVTRTVFQEDFFTLCKEMVAMSRADSPSGSWIQNTVFDISLSETSPTFSFTRNVGSDQSGVVFTLGKEIVDYYIPKDYRFIRNNITGYAVVVGPDVISNNQVDTTSRTAYYLREWPPIFGEVTNSTELTEKTKDFLKEFKDPRRDVRIVFGTGLTPFDGYVMGDNVQVRIDRGRISINSYYRVIGMEVTIDNGVEQTTPILQVKRT